MQGNIESVHRSILVTKKWASKNNYLAMKHILKYFMILTPLTIYINGLMRERHNSTAKALELHLSCSNPSICGIVLKIKHTMLQLYFRSFFGTDLVPSSIFVSIFQPHSPEQTRTAEYIEFLRKCTWAARTDTLQTKSLVMKPLQKQNRCYDLHNHPKINQILSNPTTLMNNKLMG